MKNIVTWRPSWPFIFALLVVALATCGLLIGYGPVGGDPDSLYKPIKAELSESLQKGTLPFWSDRFGLGVPLVAESHVAAFYPLNWLLYRLFRVDQSYRLSMWLHYLALVATTYAYARSLRITEWGAALAGMSFALCGFQMSHGCHEPFYCQLPYLPLVLWCAESYLSGGRVGWLAGCALAYGLQLSLGHFQIQAWTAGLLILTGVWRGRCRTATWRRILALVLSIGWGVAVACVQLGLTFELTRIVGFDRPARFLSFYSFPPAHWAQLAIPRLFMSFRDGPRDPYWERQYTSSDEACLYVGTVTVILAAHGWLARRDRELTIWRWLAPLGLVLAMLPRLAPEVFDLLLKLPVIGHFRAPGRYVLFTSLGLCLLAGRGFDRACGSRRFHASIGLSTLFAVLAFAWSIVWSGRPDVRASLGLDGGDRLLVGAGFVWLASLAAIMIWWHLPRWESFVLVPFLLLACELGFLYHQGTTPWGWPIRLPVSSPVLQALKKESNVGLVQGLVYNVPATEGVGLTVAFPYLAIFPPPPNYLLKPPDTPTEFDPNQLRWLIRSGVTHGIYTGVRQFRSGEVLYVGEDVALDRAIPPKSGPLDVKRIWRLERYDRSYGKAHIATRPRVVRDWYAMYPTLSIEDDPSIVTFLEVDAPQPGSSPRARNARIVSWDGQAGELEHDGTVDFVLRRTFYPGWQATRDDGVRLPIHRADGGFQAIRIEGAGRTRLSVSYRPTNLSLLVTISFGAVVAALVVILGSLRDQYRTRSREPSAR